MNNYQPRAPHPGRTAVEPCHTTVHATSCNTQLTPGEGLRLGEALGLQHRDWHTGRGDTAFVEVVPRDHPAPGAGKGWGLPAVVRLRRAGSPLRRIPVGVVRGGSRGRGGRSRCGARVRESGPRTAVRAMAAGERLRPGAPVTSPTGRAGARGVDATLVS